MNQKLKHGGTTNMIYTHSQTPILETCMESMRNNKKFAGILEELEEELWSLPTDSEVVDMWYNFYIPFCKKNNISIKNMDSIEKELSCLPIPLE